jgi:hypothetical protein
MFAMHVDGFTILLLEIPMVAFLPVQRSKPFPKTGYVLSAE